MPDSTATCGNIETDSMVIMSRPRPRNSTRPSAQAAVRLTAIDSSTTPEATSTELSRLCANGWSRNTDA